MKGNSNSHLTTNKQDNEEKKNDWDKCDGDYPAGPIDVVVVVRSMLKA